MNADGELTCFDFLKEGKRILSKQFVQTTENYS